MTEQQEQDLLSNMKAVTDRLTILDRIIKDAKLGQPSVMAFRCTHSGKYFPANFAKEWGKTTGIGLGPSICSESLDSQYHLAPNMANVKRVEDIMHPVQHSFAQIDLVVVPKDEYEANQLVLANDDPSMSQRAAIIRQKQIEKGGRIALASAEFARIMGGKVSVHE